MSSFLCFVCHSTVNADTNEDTRDKYREVIGMHLCPDSHLCFICCHFLNKMWLFKSICSKRSLEYPVLFSEKGTINLQRSDTQVSILCPEDLCLQHLNSKYHFYNTAENPPLFEENNYVQLHEEMHFGLLPNNVEVQTDDLFGHFNDHLLKSTVEHLNNEFLGIKETRKVDEFIFGNDSIESPLENINKIELANLEEISEVNITLTDLNVRNFDCKDYRHNEWQKDFRSCFVEKSQQFNQFVERSNNVVDNGEFVDKSHDCCVRNSTCVDKVNTNMFVEKQHVVNIVENIKPPELVRNVHFVEKPEDFVIRNDEFVENHEIGVRNHLMDNQNDDNNVTEVPNYESNDFLNDNESDVSENNVNSETNSELDENDGKSNENVEQLSEDNAHLSENVEVLDENIEKPKNIYNKISLSLEEQKVELEENRRSKKYTDSVYKCYSCALGFLFKDSYQAHTMRHEESNGEHLCLVCSLRFANPAVLRAHRANHSVRYQCNVCEQILRSKQRLSHACQRQSLSQVACDLCGKVFPSQSHYQQHLKRAHQNSNRTYTCNVCGKRCSNQAAVRTHMITHINRKFPCSICSATFSSPYTLKQHTKSHSTSQLHYCAACDVAYSNRKCLQQHYRNARAHKDKVYKCQICDRTCPTLQSLENHMAAVHTRSKDLFCAVCPARYSTRKGLVRHMRSHTDIGPKQLPLCHACGESFKSASILRRHLKNVCEKEKQEELVNYYEQ